MFRSSARTKKRQDGVVMIKRYIERYRRKGMPINYKSVKKLIKGREWNKLSDMDIIFYLKDSCNKKERKFVTDSIENDCLKKKQKGLKPCPFCGGSVQRENTMPTYDGSYGCSHVFCPKCNIRLPISNRKWNKRKSK